MCHELTIKLLNSLLALACVAIELSLQEILASSSNISMKFQLHWLSVIGIMFLQIYKMCGVILTLTTKILIMQQLHPLVDYGQEIILWECSSYTESK